MWLVYSDRDNEVDMDPLLVGGFAFRADADDVVEYERNAGARLAYVEWCADDAVEVEAT